MKCHALFVGFALLAASATRADIDITGVPIGNAHVVTPGLLRSARPSKTALRELAQRGLRTVVDLEEDTMPLQQETAWAKQEQLQFLSFPLSAGAHPDAAEMNQIEDALSDTSNYPLLVHCKFGEDRTGLVIGVFRVKAEQWTPQDAYQEMLRYDFHAKYQGLLAYFAEVTGWNPEQ